MDQDTLKLESIKAGDLYVIEKQMGRSPRGLLGVAKRCKFGYPQVIATHPILENDIFPTYLWLTCPALISELGTLESQGWVSRLEKYFRGDITLKEMLRDAHKKYAKLRVSHLSLDEMEKLRMENPGGAQVVETSGIGGTVRFDGIKCLHMHIADYLGTGGNPVVEKLIRDFPGLLDVDIRCGCLCSKWGEDVERYGVIDIGTNSTRLLIADIFGDGGHMETILRKTRITRFGRGVNSTGVISVSGANQTQEALSEYSRDIKEHGVENVMVVATSAARDATNSREVLLELSKAADLPEPRILSGEEEAYFTYQGAVRGLVNLQYYKERAWFLNNAIVLDIGGGSTELVHPSFLGTVSLNIGAVRLSEAFMHSDPITDEEYTRLIEYICNQISPISKSLEGKASRFLIGVGGTATTAVAIEEKLSEYDRERVHGYRLTKEKVADLLMYLKAMSLSERREVVGLQPGREDVVVAGMAIMLMVIESFGATEIVISDSDILEGVLWEYKINNT